MTGDNLLRLKEMFSSIQGEGVHQGRKCTFFRFAGCNLRCEWCDTRESYGEPYNASPVDYMYHLATSFGDEYIVLTGGEPLAQSRVPFLELVNMLLADGLEVGIETNGTIAFNKYVELEDPKAASRRLWVTVSPKPAGEYKVLVTDPSEIKIVEDTTVTDQLMNQFELQFPNIPLVLQLQSNRKDSYARCVELQQRHPRWLVRLQMHRVMEIA